MTWNGFMELKSKRGRPKNERKSWQRKGRRTNFEGDGVRHPSHKKRMQEKKNRTVCS